MALSSSRLVGRRAVRLVRAAGAGSSAWFSGPFFLSPSKVAVGGALQYCYILTFDVDHGGIGLLGAFLVYCSRHSWVEEI